MLFIFKMMFRQMFLGIHFLLQVTRWYYLDREEDCLEFPWGGCQVKKLRDERCFQDRCRGRTTKRANTMAYFVY
jgi:hypothetical protein